MTFRVIRVLRLPEICVVGYAFMDGLAPRGVVLWQPSFAAVLVLMALFAFSHKSMLRRTFLSPRLPDVTFLLILVSGAIYGALQTPFFFNYYAGDLGLFFVGYLYYIYIREFPDRFNDEVIKRLSLGVAATCLVSFMSSQLHLFPQFMQGTRFDYPRVLAAIGLAYAVVVSNGRAKAFYFAAFVGLAILAVMSGWRASLAWMFIGSFLIIVGSVGRNTRFFLFAVGAYLCIFPFVFRDEIIASLESLTQGTRFALLFRETGDDSFLGRVTEAQDVTFYYTSTFNLYEQIFGKGHGATFSPILSFPEDNITTGWVVHNIHFNIFLMLYRYGAFGVATYLLFTTLVIKEVFVTTISNSLLKTPRGAAAFLGLGILVLSANYTPINEVSNLYCIAAILGLYSARARSPKLAQSKVSVSLLPALAD